MVRALDQRVGQILPQVHMTECTRRLLQFCLQGPATIGEPALETTYQLVDFYLDLSDEQAVRM